MQLPLAPFEMVDIYIYIVPSRGSCFHGFEPARLSSQSSRPWFFKEDVSSWGYHFLDLNANLPPWNEQQTLLPLKMDGWNTILSYWVKRPIFRGENVSFREGMFIVNYLISIVFSTWRSFWRILRILISLWLEHPASTYFLRGIYEKLGNQSRTWDPLPFGHTQNEIPTYLTNLAERGFRNHKLKLRPWEDPR